MLVALGVALVAAGVTVGMLRAHLDEFRQERSARKGMEDRLRRVERVVGLEDPDAP